MVTDGALLLASIITTGVVAAFAPLGASILGARTRAEERRRLRHADLLSVYGRVGETFSTAISAYADFDVEALKVDPRLKEGRHIFRLLRLHAASPLVISAAEAVGEVLTKGPADGENCHKEFLDQANRALTAYYSEAGQHLIKVLGASE